MVVFCRLFYTVRLNIINVIITLDPFNWRLLLLLHSVQRYLFWVLKKKYRKKKHIIHRSRFRFYIIVAHSRNITFIQTSNHRYYYIHISPFYMIFCVLNGIARTCLNGVRIYIYTTLYIHIYLYYDIMFF